MRTLVRNSLLLGVCVVLCSTVIAVPKYGRGPEILALFSQRFRGVSYSADKLFLKNLAARQAGGEILF